MILHKSLLVLIFVWAVFGQNLTSDLTDDKIVGGIKQPITGRKFQVAVLPMNYICGGAIIRMNWIVTAAHCTIGCSPSQITVRAGSNYYYKGGFIRNVKRNIIHSNYRDASKGFDISLLKLKRKLVAGNSINAIGLAHKVPRPGTQVRVSGYGTISANGNFPKYLKSVYIQIISFSKCKANYGGGIKNSMLCAGILKGGKDSCQGDSGGPLTYNGALVGIVSWGNGCAWKNYPGIYTNVPFFRPWINNKIATFS